MVIFWRMIFQAGSLRPLWWKRCKNEAPPGGLDMQSVHACACFMKIDPFGKKSCPRRPWEGICGIFAPFLGAFGITLLTFGCPGGHLFSHGLCNAISSDFVWEATSTAGCRRRGPSGCGACIKLHLRTQTVISPCVFEHSARWVPAQP